MIFASCCLTTRLNGCDKHSMQNAESCAEFIGGHREVTTIIVAIFFNINIQ